MANFFEKGCEAFSYVKPSKNLCSLHGNGRIIRLLGEHTSKMPKRPHHSSAVPASPAGFVDAVRICGANIRTYQHKHMCMNAPNRSFTFAVDIMDGEGLWTNDERFGPRCEAKVLRVRFAVRRKKRHGCVNCGGKERNIRADRAHKLWICYWIRINKGFAVASKPTMNLLVGGKEGGGERGGL